MLLAIDTSTHFASVALWHDHGLLAEHTWLARQDHTQGLIPHIQRLLEDARATIDHVIACAVALGPGSFNGIRVGLSAAKGLSVARGLPVIGICTLELIAAEYHLSTVTMNAGGGQVYRWTGPDGVITLEPGAAPDLVRHAGVLAGLAWERLANGRVDDAAKLEPIYVRPPHITVSTKKHHVRAA